jgi:pre-rRNA-processing protein TSR2
MDSTAASTSNVPPPSILNPFASSLIHLLEIWPTLKLVISHSDHSSSPSTIYQSLATHLISQLLESPPVTKEELEGFVIEYFSEEFEVALEDESETWLINGVMQLWNEKELSEDQKLETKKIEETWNRIQRAGGLKFEVREAEEGGDVDSDEEIDEDGEEWEDEDGMEVETSAPERRERERPEPIVDEDGFTLVQKGRRGGRN